MCFTSFLSSPTLGIFRSLDPMELHKKNKTTTLLHYITPIERSLPIRLTHTPTRDSFCV